ncbi:hypothetical protein AVEN_152832-1, partial [Araneus ventricosus]
MSLQSRLIGLLTDKLKGFGVSVKQADNDADTAANPEFG